MLSNHYLKPENYTNSFAYELRKWIQNRETRVAIIGFGYVILPLAIQFMKEGFTHFYLTWKAKVIVDLRSRFSLSPNVIKA